jgi:SnoaL-like protein
MSVDLPTPVAIYIAAENRGDTEALAECFAEDAVVQDEGQSIKALAAIKQWKAETKKKYQHTIEALAVAQKNEKTVVINRLTGISLAVRLSLSSSSGSPPTRSRRSRSSHERKPSL